MHGHLNIKNDEGSSRFSQFCERAKLNTLSVLCALWALCIEKPFSLKESIKVITGES